MLLLLPLAVWPADLEKIPGARLVDDPGNDGDSFLVKAGGKQLRIRLYFVDCPETSLSAATDAERVLEQSRHFGLTNAAQVTRFGEEARRFVERTLAQPFTVHTAGANAPGRFGGRIYAFVTDASGKDLGETLVQSGLARPHGMAHESPAGVSGKVTAERLRDLEIAAMLKKAGVWAESSPERIAELREMERRKKEELERFRQEGEVPTQIIDLNTASLRELKALPGIGLKLGPRIVQGRPYQKVDDLLKVKGIGKKKLDAIRSRVAVCLSPATTQPNGARAP